MMIALTMTVSGRVHQPEEDQHSERDQHGEWSEQYHGQLGGQPELVWTQCYKIKTIEIYL